LLQAILIPNITPGGGIEQPKKVTGLKMTFSGPKMTISGYHIYGIRPNAYDLKTKFDSTSILIGYHF
jgi:hypothetical protein